MAKPIGFYKKDNKVRPITARQSILTEFMSRSENEARRRLVQKKQQMPHDVKLKTSIPVKDVTFSTDKITVLPLFYPYIIKKYPDQKWVKGDYAYALVPSTDSKSWYKYEPAVVNTRTGKVSYYVSLNVLDGVGRGLPSVVSLFHQANAIDNENAKDKFLQAWAQREADATKTGYLQYGRFSDAKAVKVRGGWTVAELKTPIQQFLDDVEQGKVKDDKGLKLSVHQVQGKLPEGGFLNTLTKGSSDPGVKKMHEQQKDVGYYAGLVVKLGPEDHALKDRHNEWAVITNIRDNYHYDIEFEGGGKATVRDTDIKGWIGDMQNDFIGIGKERHAEEVKPIIQRAMKSIAKGV